MWTLEDKEKQQDEELVLDLADHVGQSLCYIYQLKYLVKRGLKTREHRDRAFIIYIILSILVTQFASLVYHLGVSGER